MIHTCTSTYRRISKVCLRVCGTPYLYAANHGDQLLSWRHRFTMRRFRETRLTSDLAKTSDWYKLQPSSRESWNDVFATEEPSSFIQQITEINFFPGVIAWLCAVFEKQDSHLTWLKPPSDTKHFASSRGSQNDVFATAEPSICMQQITEINFFAGVITGLCGVFEKQDLHVNDLNPLAK